MAPETETPAETVKRLTKRRAALKAKVTNQLAQANDDLSSDNQAVCKKIVEELLAEIQHFDSEIGDIMAETCSDEDEIPDEVSKELSGQSSYLTKIRLKIRSLEPKDKPSPPSNNTQVSSASDCRLKLPELKCQTFSGEHSSQLEFHAFMSQFDNIIGLRTNITDSIKFTYLKTYLTGYALKLVNHLQITDANYNVAIDLLKTEFLNVPRLIDDILRKLIQIKPEFDPSFHKSREYLGEIRSLVSDLKLYELDFISDKAGCKLISRIVFNRLPVPFQQELARKINNNYPTLTDIFDNYVEVIATLNLRPNKQSISTPGKSVSRPNRLIVRSSTVSDGGEDRHPVSPPLSTPKMCKFCTGVGHTMLHCNKYASAEARRQRCDELRICRSCSSSRHPPAECKKKLDFPCKFCKSREHISALCDKLNQVSSNFCVNTSDSGRTFILPIVNLEIEAGKTRTNVRCMLDTGSQKSYLAKSVINRLKVDAELNTNLTVNTFLDSGPRSFAETSVTVNLNGNRCLIPMLVSDSFDLKLKIDGLSQCHANISKAYKLQDRIRSDEVVMEGLLGVDVLQYIGEIRLINCLGGTALQISSGVIPIGNVDNFLTNSQLKNKYASQSSDSNSSVNNSIVNFVLNPTKTTFDPIGSVAVDSMIDERLDRLFSVESLGISNDLSDYDTDKIHEFDQNISFKCGKYHVNLPWTEKISQVPSGFETSQAILSRVVARLHRDDLYDRYEAVLHDQLSEGILEEIPAREIDHDQHVFVPHRPVVKEDSVTTKVRIVLNCSMKIGSAPSINEAAYPGVDLVNNLLELLIRVRAEEYLVISDIRAAFFNDQTELAI